MGIDALFNFGSGRTKGQHARDRTGGCKAGSVCRTAIITRRRTRPSKKLRDQYVDHVAKMLTLLGDPAPQGGRMKRRGSWRLETKLAEALAHSRSNCAIRQKNYNKMPLQQLPRPDAGLELGRLLQGDQPPRAAATSTCISRSFSKRPIKCSKKRRWTIGKPICAGT